MRNKSVSLSDIAERLSISKMTVSLALRDNPRISISTRRRVAKVATEMGYKPNPEVAKFMAAIRKQVRDERGSPLAYLTTGDAKGVWRESPTELHYWQGASERAKLYGYYLEEYWLDEPHMSEARMSDIIWNRGISGLILPPFARKLTKGAKDIQLKLEWDRFASVTISDMLTRPLLNRVVHDHYTSMLNLMDALAERGYQRIGLCLTSHMDLTVNQRWQAGYRVYRANHPIQRIEPLIERDLNPELLRAWIEDNQLDAVISAERRMPDFFKSMGLQIGKQIAYADLDVDPSDPSQESISGIVQNSHMMGQAAVDMVVSAIQRNESDVPEIAQVLQVEGTWQNRGSTPNKKRAKQKSA